jgi:hypothetical protein
MHYNYREMKLLSGLFLPFYLGLLAAMALIRVLETEKSPVLLVGLTLLATAAIYGVGWLRPGAGKPAPEREWVNREPVWEDLPS